MRLLDRYLLREFLIPLGFCLSGFLLLFDVINLLSELESLQAKHLRAGDILQYYVFKTPEFLILILPTALLLALLYALTTHARHNEITAMRAAGVGLARISASYLVIGFIASVALFALDEYCVPRTADKAEEILRGRRGQQGTTEGNNARLDFKNSRVAGA